MRINLVLDIGANVGQFGRRIVKAGYKGLIVSFESLPSVFQKLKENTVRYPNWTMYNYGVGGNSGTLTMNFSQNVVSSSLLEITKKTVNATPKRNCLTYFLDSQIKARANFCSLTEFLYVMNLLSRQMFEIW